MNLSPHFSDYELKCRCGCGLMNVSPRLLMLAEKVRDILGVPLIVTSCCRCQKRNAACGGSHNSKHLCTDKTPARALDFCPKGLSTLEAYKRIVSAYKDGHLPELGGLGLYDTWLHIDTAKAADGHLRRWDYRTKKE